MADRTFTYTALSCFCLFAAACGFNCVMSLLSPRACVCLLQGLREFPVPSVYTRITHHHHHHSHGWADEKTPLLVHCQRVRMFASLVVYNVRGASGYGKVTDLQIHFQDEKCMVQVEEDEAPVEAGAISFIGALKIPGVVEFSLCLFFAKLVSYTFLYWLPTFIQHTGKEI